MSNHDEEAPAEVLAFRAQLESLLDGMNQRISGVRTREEMLAALQDFGLGVTEVKTTLEAEGEPRAAERKSRGRPARTVVLDSLEDFGFMAYTREIGNLCKALYGRDIPSTRFPSLTGEEENAFTKQARPRSVWLCYALTFDKGDAIKRLLTRSDWPLEERIVAPTTGRVQHAKITKRLCELALRAEELNAADPEMLMHMAADHARDLPGVKPPRAKPDLIGWIEVATDLLEEIEERDLKARREAAAELEKHLDQRYLLFGRPRVIEGVEKALPLRRKQK